MLNSSFVEHFVADWIAAWNAPDLQKMLSHYADDFEMISPVIVKLVSEPSGVLRGKQAVGSYWQQALQRVPDLKFELMGYYMGVDSVAIHYIGVRQQLVCEVFHFNEDGLVERAFAHYIAQ